MDYRKIPQTELSVSSIGLGTWAFGDKTWGIIEQKSYIDTVKAALDAGINFIDTAPIYGSGRSEEIVGKAIKGKREKVILATKCGLRGQSGKIIEDLSSEFIQKEIEDSLRRLGVDFIDLYQCHWPDEATPVEDTFSMLNKLQKEGKIRYIGVSNFSADLIRESLEFAKIVTTQNHYSFLERSVEKDLHGLCLDKQIGMLTYGSLGGGILTGKYKQAPNFKPSDARSFFYKFYKGENFQKAINMVEALEEISSEVNKPVGEVALNWLRSKNEVVSVLAGSKTKEQVNSNASAGTWDLSEGQVKRLDSCKF